MAALFADRLSPETYADDEPCAIRLMRPVDPSMEGWISERLVGRLRHLALAYDLPLLGRLPAHDETAYPEVQLASIEDELSFLFGMVTDDVLLAALAPLQEMLRRAARDPRGWRLVVEAP